MEKIKVENWNGCNIRFVECNGEWWAVLKDICVALALSNPTVVANRLDNKHKQKADPKLKLGSHSNEPITIISEFGIYDAVFQSRKKEAKDFRHWVYSMLKELRQQSGLQGFEIFRMLDKEHQREQMRILQQSRRNAVPVDFIKANTIANKAVSNAYGYGKMVRKAEMTPEMLVAREPILEDTVELMGVKDKYELDISVSDAIYAKTAGSGRGL